MDITAFSQLGIGLATLLILWFVVKYFTETLTRKDEQMSKVISDFTVTIANHIAHETAAQNKTSTALDGLTKAIVKLSKVNVKP